MFRLPSTAAVLASALFCVAQNKEIDSLERLLKNHPAEDTARLNLLNQMAFAQTDNDKGLQFAGKAVELGRQLNDVPKLARAHLLKANFSFEKFAYDEALSETNTALQLSQQAGDKKGQMNAHWIIGRIFNSQGRYHASIAELKKAYEAAQAVEARPMQTAALNSLASNYLQLADYPMTIKIYYDVLSLAETFKDSSGIAMAYMNLGLTNRRTGNNKKAISFYERSLALYRQLNNAEKEAEVLNYIGTVYDQMDQTEKAFGYWRMSHAINRKGNLIWGLLYDYGNMGQGYISLKKYDSAIQMLKTGLPLTKKVGDKNNEAGLLQYLGTAVSEAPQNVLQQNGILPAKRYSVARAYLEASLAISSELKALDSQFYEWEALAEIYKKQKAYPLAFAAQKKMLALKDSMYNDEKKETITRAELQYEFIKVQDSTKAAYDKQQALATAEVKQQKTVRNLFTGGSGLIVLSGILLFLSYKRRRDAVAKKNDAELNAQIADTEMKVMRLQMNPHFIFNSLNSISDYIIKNKPEEADAYLSKFAKVMRMTLENSEQQAISLEDDLKTLELYMQLEARRLNDKFTYQINVSPEIDKENTLVPPLIFQPFVENSIWHGIAKKEGQGHILIDIKKEGEMLYCLIDDDGAGRPAATETEAPKERQSLGMKITRARIDILNKLKGANATVQLIDKPQGLLAELKLPLETAF